jgi:hypothetical protein
MKLKHLSIDSTRGMRSRGKGINREVWFSFCSKHHTYNKDCHTCNIGNWERVIVYKLNSLVYNLFPSLWIWMRNR